MVKFFMMANMLKVTVKFGKFLKNLKSRELY
jgi:hypothetical protein